MLCDSCRFPVLSLILLAAAGLLSAPRFSTAQTAEQYVAQAVQFYAQQDWNKAIETYSKALMKEPKRTDALLGRGLSYMAKGQADLALKDYRAVIKIDPKGDDAFNAHMIQREMLERKGDLNGALAEVKLALAIKPDDAGAYIARAKLLESKGDLKGALADCNKAISLRPRAFGVYDLRGRIKNAMGDLDGAIADFDKALELNPRQPPLITHRGEAKKKKGDDIGALADFEQALGWNTGYVPALIQRGLMRLEKGDETGAQKDFDKALKKNPSLKESLQQSIEKVKAKR
jgi:tetratricopeptide (TPR) repeat protein